MVLIFIWKCKGTRAAKIYLGGGKKKQVCSASSRLTTELQILRQSGTGTKIDRWKRFETLRIWTSIYDKGGTAEQWGKASSQ